MSRDLSLAGFQVTLIGRFWVTTEVFPLIVPFILIANDLLALRISNATAICLLFLAGYSFGCFTESHPWRAGLAMVVLGLVVVGIAVFLGG